MPNTSEREATYGAGLTLIEETSGAAVLRWGALIALVVETVLVIGGIIFATLQAFGR
ncbi:MAG TPA: hypothetical protein VKV96_02990 [Roseiarcus sp.]|nr:hypothetical protein [Roseiarcus sp.]